MALQLSRGTNAQRLAVTPLDGELIVVTDYAAAEVSPLWLGDGATVGGIVPITLELDDLTDVVLAELVDKQILQYDGLTGLWNNVSNPVLTGLTAGNVTVGLTDNNAVGTTTGDLNLTPASGVTSIGASLRVDGGTLWVDSVNNRVGVANLSPTYPLDVTGIARATGGVNASLVKVGISATGTIDTISGDLTLDAATDIVRVNADAVVSGDLAVNGGDLTTTSSVGNLFNANATTVNIGNGATTEVNIGAPGGTSRVQIKSPLLEAQGNAIIAGNLTVNGELTYLNVQDLQVEDKNILMARGNTSDAVANGGGITLKGATDKTINWYDADNRWYFNGGDGVEHEMIIGEFTTLSERAKFINNAGGIVSAEFLKRVTTAADGDNSGIFFGNIDASNNKLLTQRITSEYDAVGNNILRVQTDPVGNFAPSSTTVRNQFRLDDNSANIAGTQVILNGNQTTGAPDAGLTASLRVNRGSSTEALLSWVESTGFWSFNNPVFVQGGLVGSDFLGINGLNIYFNNEDGTPSAGDNANLIVKRGSGVDVVFRWNEGIDRWESTTDGTNYIKLPNQGLDTGDNALFGGVQSGNIRVGITGDNEIDTTTGNLTIDSAGGTTTIDDAVIVTGNLTVDTNTLVVDAANNQVSIAGAAVSGYALTVNGGTTTGLLDLDNRAAFDTGALTTTTAGSYVLNQTTRDSLKMQINVTDNVTGKVQCLEILALRDGSQALFTTYAEMHSAGGPLAYFTADIDSGNLRVLCDAGPNNTTFTYVRHSLT